MKGTTGKSATLVASVVLFSIIFTLVFAPSAFAVATSPSLGTAGGFAVLAGQAVTNVPTSAITGDVGLIPAAGSNYAGLTAAEVTGTIYAVDATGPAGSVNDPGLLTTAKTDLVNAYNGLAVQACDITYAGTKDLVGENLVPGVYCADAFALSGTLTLSGSGAWVFKSTSTLITSDTANVIGGDPCNMWWWVASSATLGTNTQLTGNILALTSITLDTGATLDGRALAQTAAVTLASNNVDMTCGAASTPISISKVFDTSTARPGDVVGVTLTVTNTGGATLNSIQVVDVLPSQLTYADSASPVQSSVVGQTITWDIVGSLEPGDSIPITFLVRVNPSAGAGIVGNFASATGNSGDGAVSTDTITGIEITIPPKAVPSMSSVLTVLLVSALTIIGVKKIKVKTPL
jgi:uncharacterized repeat protein (TIGR01451 family)